MQPWNPEQYLRFKSEREKPALDLLEMIEPIPGGTMVDLGCGTGELTALFLSKCQAKMATAIDESYEMLEKAKDLSSQKLHFKHEKIEEYEPEEPLDLIVANASLHWVKEHPHLFNRLRAMLKSGGQIAIQMPMNFDFPTHIIAKKVAANYGIKAPPQNVLKPEEYAKLLYTLGFQKQRVSLHVYPHLLASTSDAVEWVKGSLLTYYEKQLTKNQFHPFLEEYKALLIDELGEQTPFFFPFKRLLIWGKI